MWLFNFGEGAFSRHAGRRRVVVVVVELVCAITVSS